MTAVATDAPITDETCKAFRELSPDALTPDAVHRFVVGEDTTLQVLTAEEAAGELGDPFATELLLKGTFPRTAGEVLSAFAAAMPEGDLLRAPMFFLVGDGSQIPFSAETADVARNLRFLVTLGNGSEGPDVMLSAFNPEEGDVELMAWDHARGGFNYYQTVGDSSSWVFAGNSRHALLEATEGKGPFESHPSGNVIMKELRTPWINWDSPAANILPSAFAPDDPLRDHPWFNKKDPQGAITCEASVVRPGIERWTKARFATIAANGGKIERPERIMRQVLTSPAVNLGSSHTETSIVASTEAVDLPPRSFVDSAALTETLDLQAPPAFTVPGSRYAAALTAFDVALTDGDSFSRPGDTHFVFLVPERAAEDQAVVVAAIDSGLLTERLAACLLMVDFANPVFSERRAALLRHVPPTATITNDASDFSQALADAILAAAASTAEGSPEHEFAERWNAGEAWREAFNPLLESYYAAVTARLSDQEGFNDLFRLAEARRQRVRQMPIFESPLLFAQTNIPASERVMQSDGTVIER